MALEESAISGVKWSSLTQVARLATQWVTIAVLARILTPNDFGLVGIAMVFVGFITIFRDLGTSASVIQRHAVTESLLSSLFWVNALFGLASSAFLFLFAPVVSLVYQNPEVASLLRVLSLTFFISGLGIIHQAYLERNLEFRKIAFIEMLAVLLGAVTGIVSAILGFGVWSLVYQVIVTTFTTTIMLWLISKWRPRAIFHLSEVKAISSFSLNLTGFNIINYFARNADNLIIGYFLGPEALGYYNLAYRLMLVPVLNVTYVVSRVVFPIYSQIQNDNSRLRRAILKIEGTVAFITIPIMLGMMVLRNTLVTNIFGSQWGPVTTLILILAPVGIIQSLVSTTGPIFQAKGRTDLLLKWGSIFSFLYVISFFGGLRWGIFGVALAYAATNFALIYPNFAIPFKLINLPVIALARLIWRSLVIGMIMLLFIFVVRSGFKSETLDILTFGLLMLLAAMSYVGLSWAFNRKQILLFTELFRVRALRSRSGTFMPSRWVNNGRGGGVVLTFDDAFIDEWYDLRELFLTYDAKATFFVSGADKFSKDSIEKLRILQDDGHEIGFHTLTHCNAVEFMNGNSLDKFLTTEISPGVEKMHALGFQPSNFAYPYGARARSIDRALLKCFKYVRGTSYTTETKRIVDLGEVYYKGGRGGAIFGVGLDNVYRNSIEEVMEGIDKAKKQKKALIFYAHKPSDGGGDYCVPFEKLETIIKYCYENEAEFYRVDEL